MIYYWHMSDSPPQPGEEVLAAYFVQDENFDESSFCIESGVFWFPAGSKATVKPRAKTASAFIKETEKTYQLIEEEGWYKLDLINNSGYLLYRKIEEPMFWTQILMPDTKIQGPVEWCKGT